MAKREMKVWGCNVDGRHRGIVATKTKKAAASALGVTMHHFNLFAAETGNQEEVRIAMSSPGSTFYKNQSKRDEDWKAER